MAALPHHLQSALDSELARYPQPDLTRAVQKLITRYRDDRPAGQPILATERDVAAYAGYRMPATYAAVRSVLGEVARLAPEFSPRSMVDLGGGTGAALWAACETWPSLDTITVVERAPRVLEFGRRLAAQAHEPAVRRANWRHAMIDPRQSSPSADLVTLSYVLGELPENLRDDTVRWLAAGPAMVVLIEPGTPAGYERILAARNVLTAMGLSLVAPCPHALDCPIPRGKDWCHFATRLPRTQFHQLVKDGALNFEDEKFSYIAASTTPLPRATNRIVRHPQKRKGLVSLRLCTGDGHLTDTIVTKRHGDSYRAARDVTWGDGWP